MSNAFSKDLAEQAQAVFEILSDVYDKSPWTYEQVLADVTKSDTDYFYAYDNQAIIGFLSLQQLVGECEITNIAIKSSYQGQGYGKLLMDKIAELDVPVFLEVRASNKRAQALYERAGFECLGTRKAYYHEPVEDAVIMRRG